MQGASSSFALCVALGSPGSSGPPTPVLVSGQAAWTAGAEEAGQQPAQGVLDPQRQPSAMESEELLPSIAAPAEADATMPAADGACNSQAAGPAAGGGPRRSVNSVLPQPGGHVATFTMQPLSWRQCDLPNPEPQPIQDRVARLRGMFEHASAMPCFSL